MSLYRVGIGLFLFLLTPCVSQQVRFNYNNDPQVIRDVLKDAHVSGSLVFSGGCRFRDRTAPVPSVGTSRHSGSVRETLQNMLAVNSKMRVTQDPDGMIRIVEEDVPTDILEVKIHRVSFPGSEPISFDQSSGPLYMNGRYQALTTILATPEVAAFKKAHHIDSDGTERVPGNLLSQSKSLELTGELNDVTVSQALDYVLKTFPGYWVYEDASCENGDRAVRFKFY